METPLSGFQRSLKPKTATELVKEIAVLEMQVMQLEKHLLSLYEKAFDRRITSSLSGSDMKMNEGLTVSSDCARISTQDKHVIDTRPLEECYGAQEQNDILGSSIHHRTHSSLSHHTAYAITQSSPLTGKVAEAVNSYHSLPLTMLENATGEASNYMITYGQITQTANWLSEEMVRCVSAIYCKLAANASTRNAFTSPVVSSISLMSCSPSTEFHLWSPQYKMNSSVDLHSDVSLNGGCQEFSGPYSEVIEVLQISRDSEKMREIDPMLQKFSSLVCKLEELNPSKLKHEEKLAFWINVHNALVMHAYLVYGVPQIKLKKISLLLKAAYNVGGHNVSVGMMQNYILGSRLPFLGQWFVRLFHRNKRSRTRDDSRYFGTDHPEPLSYFALCCGSRSDPPVRIYTPKRVYQELVSARRDYILCNYRVNKDQTSVLLPRVVETYAKDSSLHPADFRAILEQILPADLRRNKESRYHWPRKGQKGIGWIPHDTSFRYQFIKELLL